MGIVRQPSRGAAAAAPASGGGDRLRSIQVLRGLAALSVVAFHATAIERKYFSETPVLPGVFGEGMVGVDLFFVISGFVMVQSTRGRHGGLRAAGVFLWNRFFRIYPTYWFFFVLLLPVLLLAPGWINAGQGNRVDLIASFLLLPSDLLPLLLVAWTLTIELWFYLVFAVLLLLPERVLPIALTLWFVVLVVINLRGPVSAGPFLEVSVNAMAIEFVLGAAAALLSGRLGRRGALIAVFVGAVLIATLGEATPQDLTAGPGLLRPLTLGPGFASIVLGVTAWESRGGIGALRRFAFFGDISYSVYLSHVLVLSVMGRVWAAGSGAWSTSVPAVIVWWIATLAAVLLTGDVSHRFVERPVMALSRRWRRAVFREP